MVALNVVKTVTVQSKLQGVDQDTAKLKQMGAATGVLSAAMPQLERQTLSAGRALERHSMALDGSYRSTQKLAQVTEDLQRAQAQGLVTAERVNELLSIAAVRYGEVAVAASRSGQAAREAAGGWQYFSTQGLKNLANDNASQRIANMGNSAKTAAGGVKLAAGEVQNMSFQLNDIMVSLASGQSPFTVIMQQGMQMAQIFGPGVGVAAALKATGAAIGSFLLNPLTLTVAGLAAVAGAASYFFSSSDDGARKVGSALKSHAETLREIKDLYAQANGGLKDMADQSERVLRFEAQAALARQQSALRAQTSAAIGAVYQGGGVRETPTYDALGNVTGSETAVENNVVQRFAPFQELLDRLRQTGDVRGFREELVKFAEANPAVRSSADELKTLTDNADELARGIPALEAAVNGLNSAFGGNPFASYADGLGKIINMIPRLRDAQRFQDQRGDVDRALSNAIAGYRQQEKAQDISPAQANAAIAEARARAAEARAGIDAQQKATRTPEQRMAQAYDFDIRAITARTVAQRAALAADRAREEALQDSTRAHLADTAAQNASALVYAEAAETARQADRERAVGLREQFAARQMELAQIGASTAAREAALFKLQQYQEIERETLTRGTAWAEQQKAAIDALAPAWGKLAEQAEQARKAQDVLKESSLLGLPENEARIRSQFDLDAHGNIINANDRIIAQQMRQNDLVKEMNQAVRGTGKDLLDAWANGETGLDGILEKVKGFATQKLGSMIDDQLTSGLNQMFGGKVPGIDGVAAPMATGTITVTAATVQIMGGAGGIPGLGLTGGVPQAGAMANDNGQYAGLIRQSAMKYGIDPEVALRVARSEGGTSGWIQSSVVTNGAREPSYGPFQMLVGGKGTGFPRGLGNNLLDRGIDPRNPAYAPQTIDYAMEHASRNGWGAWYGAAKAGIGNHDGIGQAPQINTAQLQQQLAGLQTATQQAATAIPNMTQTAAQAAPALGGLAQQGGAAAGFFQNLFNMGGGAAGAGGGVPSFLSFLPFEAGGVMTSRGRLPLRAYSSGGIARSPQLAMYGEGSVPEAYVPVPSGRIPVEMRLPAMITPPASGSGGSGKTEMHFHNAPGRPEMQEQDDGRGNRRVDFIFPEQVANAMTKTPAQKALRGYGVTKQVRQRG